MSEREPMPNAGPDFEPSIERRSIDDSSIDDELAQLLGLYADRLLAGERVEPEEIRRRHPQLAETLIHELETLAGLGADPGPGGVLETLGDYRILRRIGQGGMGVVYEALDARLDRHVALKVLPRQALSSAKSVARFVKEARIAGRLKHPGIVGVFGMGVDRGVPFYAMEYVEGQTLAQLLREQAPSAGKSGGGAAETLLSLSRLLKGVAGEPPPGESTTGDGSADADSAGRAPDALDLGYCLRLARAFAEVADALEHAHRRGVTHRDLKPSNLILDLDGRLRILDFGLARLEGEASLTQSGDLVGTILYMSPEQAMARRVRIDHRSDLYSLGATIYEALAFRPPFRGRDHRDTLSQILFREPAPLRKLNPRVPRDLETIVLKCLAKDPGERYGSAEALAQDLRRCARGDPIEARPLAAWERWARRAWRRKGLAAALVAAALGAASAGALLEQSLDARRAEEERRFEARVIEAMMLVEYGKSSPARRQPRPRPLGESYIAFALEPEPDEFAGVDPLGRALELLGEAAALRPGRPEPTFHRARALLGRGERAQAEDLLRPLLHSSPPFAPARALQGLDAEAPGAAPRPEAAGNSWEDLYLQAQRAGAERRRGDAIEALTALIDGFIAGREPYLGALAEARLARGRLRLEQGEVEEAVADFAAVAIAYPQALEPALFLARAYLLRKRRDSAAAELERAYQRAPAEFRGGAAAEAARVLFDFKSFDEALGWTERITDAAQREQRRALCLAERREAEAAIEAAKAAVALAGGDALSRHTLGTVYAALKRHQDAAAEFRAALALNDRMSASWNALGLALLELERHGEAREAYERALAIDPRDASALNGIGNAYLNEGRFAEAGSVYERAIALEPRSFSFHNNAGIAAMRQGRIDDAVAAFRRALDLDPENALILSNLSWALIGKGAHDEGIAAARRGIALDPGFSENYKMLGGHLFRRGAFLEAREAYLKYVELRPDHFIGHHNLALVHERFGDFDDAAREYERCLELKPGHGPSAYNLGNLFYGRGRWQDAVSAYERALKIAPDDDSTLNNLGLALFLLERFEEAAAAFEKAIAAAPESAEAYWNLAAVHEKRGDLPAAIERHRQGIERSPGFPVPYGQLAAWLEKTGDADGAERTLRRELELRRGEARAPGVDAAARAGLADALLRLAALRHRQGDAGEARELAAEALSILEVEALVPGAPHGAHAAFARALLDAPAADLRDPRRALLHARRAVEISLERDPEALEALARAFDAGGNRAEALAALGRAIALFESGAADAAQVDLRARLEDRRKEWELGLEQGRP
jgi:tetratricopeptide (TPR) repeat protein/serine/threonine protein kinase